MTYQKLFPIDYNNKKFMLFLDENNHKTFLEIDSTGEYVYPTLEDYLALYKIFNIKEPFICYAPRFTFKEKVRVAKSSIISLLTVITILNSIPTASAANIKVEEQENSIVISEEVEQKEQQVISITDTADLEKYLGHLNVTKEMVIEAINENVNLPTKFKKIALNLLNIITEKYSNFDLRIFYENIKTMEITEYTIEEFRQTYPETPGAGAQYNALTNKITTIDEVPIEILYHEMFHATHYFYRKLDEAIVMRVENNTALDESFTDLGSSLVVPNLDSYVLSGKVLNYLLSTVDYSIEDYNNKGVSSFLEVLQNKYPDIDFNYIGETLNAINDNIIYQGKQTHIDSCPDFIDELFKLCLKNVSLENGYEPFNNFAQVFYNAKNPELIFTYLTKYNEQLKTLGYQNIITEKEAKQKWDIYKETTGIGYTDNEFFPVIINEEENKKVENNGNKIDCFDMNYSNTFDFPSLVSSTMFEIFDNFGTSTYWQELGINNGLINPCNINEIPIYYQNKLLTTTYTIDISIQVGLMEHNRLGYILTNCKTGEILYQSTENMKYLSNVTSLNYYISKFSNYIEKLDLEDVLNMNYLKVFQRNTSQFKNIKTDGNFITIEPLQAVYISKDNIVQVCYLNDGTVVINDGIASISNTNISFEISYPANEIIKLQDIFANSNMLDNNVTSYNLTENEIITMINNYLQELRVERGR